MTAETPASVIFFGTPDFAVKPLIALMQDRRYQVRVVVTQPDKPAGRGARISESPVKKLAKEAGIPILQPAKIKSEIDAFLSDLKRYGSFDVGVVVAFGQILPQSLLDLPRTGFVNIHASLLPRWRGAAPIQRAILAGDEYSGICLMRMEAGLDTGPVYSQRQIKIEETMNAGMLHDTLSILGAELICADLMRIVNGDLLATPQAQQGITYANKISAAESKIDWSRSAREIWFQTRGLAPFPGAYCMFRAQRLKILESRVVPRRSGSIGPRPGSISFLDSQSLEIACRDEALSLLEVQPQGKVRMKTVDFLNGSRLAYSDIFE